MTADSALNRPVPVVIWHGMGDSCCNPNTIGQFKRLIEENIKNVYVYSIQIGNTVFDDTLNGFFMDSNTKIEMACNKIKSDPNLSKGYNAMGFSQGSQFLRAVAQRCPHPPMFNLISLGGQHQGVYGLPDCTDDSYYCSFMRKLISVFAYYSFFQKNIVQASYWHDPMDDEINYSNYNLFLADINQVKKFNPDYKNNLLKLKALVLVKFIRDQMVVPIESQWFGFYKTNNPNEIYTMEESPLYLNDTLGLKTLDTSGRLHKYSINGRHLQIDRQWFIENLLQYLK